MLKGYNYILSVVLFALLNVGCTQDVIDRGGDDNEEELDSFIVEWMDGILSQKYLYNDEYNTLSRDVELSYDIFLDTYLTAMSTNVLDYKDGSLYSYITRVSTSSISMLAETRISDTKQSVMTIGLASAVIVSYSDSSTTYGYGVGVLGVYPGSQLADAGVTRGDIIVGVNNTSFSSSNITSWAQIFLEPLNVGVEYILTLEDGREVTVNTEMNQCNPVLLTDVYEVDSKKIGYIHYFSFDAAWDSELMEAMADFQAKGVTDIILDMRLNGGGYVSSANKLASAIGGAQTEDQIFAYYTYNPTRMASLSDSYKTENFQSSWSSYHLDLDNVVCLVSGSTASASELVINSLEGIGVDVKLIGERTEGKNVAMEESNMTYDGYYYSFLPISIIVSNVEDYTQNDYSTGFAVDYQADDWGDWGENFSDFDQDEIMISAAINYITTGSYETATSPFATKSESVATPKSKGATIVTPATPSGNIFVP